MATYNGSSGVATWYEEYGRGDPLVMLHPAATDSRAFGPNLDALAARFHVYTPDRRGHGRTADADGPITFDLMAADTVEFLEQVVGGPADLVGCSDGAVVALTTALRRAIRCTPSDSTARRTSSGRISCHHWPSNHMLGSIRPIHVVILDLRQGVIGDCTGACHALGYSRIPRCGRAASMVRGMAPTGVHR